MSRSVLYMSMSVDGFISGPNDRPGNPGGDGFGRLHDWLDTEGPATGRMMEEMNATGAVLAGRRTVERADHIDVLPSCIELEIVRVIDTPEATHIRYRVRR